MVQLMIPRGSYYFETMHSSYRFFQLLKQSKKSEFREVLHREVNSDLWYEYKVRPLQQFSADENFRIKVIRFDSRIKNMF